MSAPSRQFPLSPQQRRLWSVGGRDAGSPFVARCRARITGRLDVDAMMTVLRALSDRHEILRTALRPTGEGASLVQIIADEALVPEYLELPLPFDLAALEREGSRRSAITLARLTADEHLVLIRVPALCCDRMGLENLVADVWASYQAATEGGNEGPVLQYADAAAWLNEAVESPDAEPGRAFWRSAARTDGAPRLPFDRLAQQCEEGAALATPGEAFQPSTLAVGPLAAFSPEHSTPEWLAVACWQHVLERITDTEGVSMSFVHDGRHYAELEGAVGLYERTLPVPPLGREATTASERTRALAAAVADATQWADAYEWTSPKPVTGAAMAPFVFEVRRRAQPLRGMGNVTCHVEESEAYTDRFALKLVCSLSGNASALTLQYDAARYREEDVLDLAAGLRVLLAHAAHTPGTPLRSLPLIDSAGSSRQSDEPPHSLDTLGLVHQRFEAHARQSPDRPAVTCEEQQLTFGELNARANQLAHRLRRLGVGPDTAVGLCAERSVHLVVGLLGILKAGGGYVALDPQLPAGRLALMVEAAGATLVVTDRATRASKPIGQGVLLDDERESLSDEPTVDLPSLAQPRHLAYILFTSGSTGQPKGVAVEHRNLARYVAAVCGRLELPEGASYATVTTIAADLGNTTVYPALTGGGHLHVVREDRAADAERFAEYCERHRIDVLKIVPSHLRALLSASAPERVLPAARLVLGGEACPWDLVELVRRLAPACRVFNHYGPTETTVGVTTFEVTDDRGPLDGLTVPIGRPLDHALTYVLDEARRPMPRWFVGELYIGGSAVTRGYVNAPIAADPPFVPDPFRREPGARMYRTGDRVRLRAHGEIEFLGRVDDQVKIRGFRIEPGEIAAVLREHGSVEDATVLAFRPDGGQPRLVAAVATRDDTLTERDLKAYLGARLLEAMVPARVALTRTLPRTANGKIDRAAVESLAASAPPKAMMDSAPSGEWEQAVAEVWRELLDLDHVSPTDNFYDLGGHSLLAIQAVTSLEKRRGIRLAARDLVFHTLRQVAALCESKTPIRA